MKPIALTDSELDIVMHAAAPLQPPDRDGFLQAVAKRLTATPERGDGTIFRICRETQRECDGPQARRFATTR
jgi:hypothetical protein